MKRINDPVLDREAVRRYEELSEIFSEKDNYSQSRELLKEVSFPQDQLRSYDVINMCSREAKIWRSRPKR